MKSKNFIYIFLIFILFSCGASNEEERLLTLTSVENLLTQGKCDSALTKINSIEPMNDNALYIKLKASAYACRADYSTITFFGTDIPNLSTIDTTNNSTLSLLSMFSTFSISQTYTGPGDADYDDMKTAIDTLLYAGGLNSVTNPSAALRAEKFNSKDSAEINSFLLYLVINQMGKYFYHYGATTALGAKSTCMYSYSNLDGGALGVALGAAGGNCTGVGVGGHADLTSAGPIMNVSRACEGIVLFNNFRDALANISSIGSISGALNTAVGLLEAAIVLIGTFNDSSILTVKSQTKCEADFGGGAGVDNDDLQRYFGYIFEILHNKV